VWLLITSLTRAEYDHMRLVHAGSRFDEQRWLQRGDRFGGRVSVAWRINGVRRSRSKSSGKLQAQLQVQHQNVVFPKGCAPALHSTLRSIDAVALRSDDSWSVAVLCQEHG